MNKVQERPATQRPHKGRVVGAGVGHKHSHYYPDTKEAREERKRQETLDINQRLDSVTSSIPEIVKQQVAEQVAAQFRATIGIQQQALIAWDRDGRKGPMPLLSIGDSNSINVAATDAPDMEAPAAAAPATDAPAMEVPAENDQLPTFSVPGSSPSVSCPPAVGPTPLAELNALTVTCPRFGQHSTYAYFILAHCLKPNLLSQANEVKCTFLLKVGNELKEVAKGSIVNPLNRMLHTVEMGPGEFRVTLARVFPGYEDLDPPHQPPGADSELKLGQCLTWPLKWPKALIRLDPVVRSQTVTPVGETAPS